MLHDANQLVHSRGHRECAQWQAVVREERYLSEAQGTRLPR